MTENQSNGIMEEPDKDNSTHGESQQPMEQNHQAPVGEHGEQANEEPIVEERTQADHMDKKLLCAFLDRLNQMSTEPITERLETDRKNDFEDNENA